MDLADLVAPMPWETFLATTFGRETAHFEGTSDRFHGLFGWPQLSRILSEQRLSSPRLRVVKDGDALPAASYTRLSTDSNGAAHELIDSPQLLARLRQGATLVLDSVSEVHEPLQDLCYSLERTVREAVSANAYASWAREEAFGLHWDNHDVLVLQLDGYKEWTLHGTGRQWPTRTDVAANHLPDGPAGAPIVLAPGDVLHVPRGVWHSVRALRPPSLHLTLGITRRTGHDLLLWLSNQLLTADVVRQDLPRFEGPAARAAHLGHIRAQVLDRLTDDALLSFFAHHDGTAAPSRSINLRAVWPEDARGDPAADPFAGATVEWLAPRAVLTESADADGTCALRANGYAWQFRSAVGGVLRRLIDRRVIAYDNLRHAASGWQDPDSLSALVDTLQREGLLVVNDPA